MSGYIGPAPVPQATQTRQAFTATSGQTTFNTAGYTPGYLDVYLNGVKLAAADYTASNGSDIVLAAGAAANDILEVVAFDIFQVVDQDFTGDFTVDGNTFVVDSTNNRVGIGTTSPTQKLTVDDVICLKDSGSSVSQIMFGDAASDTAGRIFYQHSAGAMQFFVEEAERMRINSSGILLVGKTADNLTDAGQVFSTTGSSFTRSNGATCQFNRNTSDGEVIRLSKDGTTVGSIGNAGSNVYFAQSSKGVGVSSARIYPITSSGSVSDNTMDLGNTDARWKDAYLSGTAYTGGLQVADGTGAYFRAIRNSDYDMEIGNYSSAWGYRQTSYGSAEHVFKYTTHGGSSVSEAMRIRSDGIVAVNDSTDPTAGGFAPKLHVKQGTDGVFGGFTVEGHNSDVVGGFGYSSTSQTFQLGASYRTTGGYQPLALIAGGNERMRVWTDGTVTVGKSTIDFNTAGFALRYQDVFQVTRADNPALEVNRIGSDGEVAGWYRQGTRVGGISVTSSGTTYNTTSDRRLKTDIEPIADGTEKLMAMNPVTHKWIADPDADAVHGFIAQEMQEVVPEAVSGEADGEEMMSMDYGRITPVLVAALQDAHKKIELLEQRLADLEGK